MQRWGQRERTSAKHFFKEIVLFMWYSPIHIIHYEFYCYEGTWNIKEGKERKIFSTSHDYKKSRQDIFAFSRSLANFMSSWAACLLASLWFPPARYKSKYLYEFINVLFRNLLRCICTRSKNVQAHEKYKILRSRKKLKFYQWNKKGG